jgi:PIN domain nuclease of toxin-antitoxin system
MRKRTRSSPAGKSAHLLDTATILWALSAPERLSTRARDRVGAGRNVVSVASYWEVVVKTQKGLLTITDVPIWWQRATDLLDARVLSIQPSHVTALAGLPLHHKDPFDRILVAQAITEGLDFITGDQPIRAYPVRVVW